MSENSRAAAAALSRELDRIEAMPGGDEKTAAIRDLAREIQALYDRAAGIRKGEMLRIRDAETLSLAQLASRVGISKARADQLVKPRRRKKEDRDV